MTGGCRPSMRTLARTGAGKEHQLLDFKFTVNTVRITERTISDTRTQATTMTWPFRNLHFNVCEVTTVLPFDTYLLLPIYKSSKKYYAADIPYHLSACELSFGALSK